MLIGHYGSQNRGCEAIVRTTVQILAERFPGSHFTLASINPENDGPLWDVRNMDVVLGVERRIPTTAPMTSAQGTRLSLCQVLKLLVPYGLVAGLRRWREAHPAKTSRDSLSSPEPYEYLRSAIEASDVVLSVGGDNYTEDYGPPIYYMDVLEYAQKLGRKTVIWAASIGPFQTEWVRQRMVRLMKNTNLIAARDDLTVNYLASLGIRENVKRVADPAFLLEPRFSERTCLPWDPRPDNVMGFNGSGFLFKYLSTEQAGRALDALVEFFRDLVDSKEFHIILVPHDTAAGSPFSDWPFLSEFRRRLQRDECVSLISPGLDAREAKAVIGQCDYFVGMKMHATIAALSQGVPTIGLSYSAKYEGLHKFVYGHTKYLIPFARIAEETLPETFAAMRCDTHVAVALQQSFAQLQVLAHAADDAMDDLLGHP